MIYGPGMWESGITMSLGQVVSDADFVRMIKTVLVGVPVNEETLAIDVIHSVGIKGQYLGEDHTFEHFRQVQSSPLVMDRNNRQDWLAEGGKDMAEKSAILARKILETHKPSVLSNEAIEKIHQIVLDAEKQLLK
ncbi:hypothetical protein SPACI_039620 [Sporomusa acidovorans DSM 3132]|uniref:Trimethylamine methyltransferase MttB n=1 Tax=Sporomusa acidovorans (strain ATCC 49682 / DSM 3132 / Mol) TaxID=1123286 RepID=A0ABZ3J641_SPOA4|nr:trimethylamine methyltransferase MttB [Sporomusa acidovorans DSM 3132]SDE37136.1 trimethylamine---corrinoid protein Co-methyltransferase [Sporomusa acidovorans]